MAILQNKVDRLHSLYADAHRKIADHKLAVAEFARTETLRDGPEVYEEEVGSGERNRSASYEAALSGGRGWKPGDRISYYIVGSETSVKGFENCKLAEDWDPNFPDENTAYYLKRLEELSRKFETFFTPQDFRAIFSLDDLFPFSAQGIEIVTAPVEAMTGWEEERDEAGTPEPKIWLGDE
jgi:DNA polymerase I